MTRARYAVLRSKVIVSAPKAQADSTLKCSPCAMSSLATLWKGGREGTLSPLEQMKAWALREAQKDLGGEEAVCFKKIAERVTKIGGGHPGREAIHPQAHHFPSTCVPRTR